jgi:hypothetical protein
VVSADDIDNGLKVDGFPTTSFGVTFDRLADVDRINVGDFDDEVDTAGIPRPRCSDTDFLGVNDMIEISIDLPS